MTLPLIVLAILSVAGGFVQLPHAFGGHSFFNEFLAPIVPSKEHEDAGLAMKEYYLLAATVLGWQLYILQVKNSLL